MSNIKTFRNNENVLSTPSELVRAVKVTEANLITVKDWAGQYAPVEALIKVNSKGDTYDHRIRVKTPKGWRVARVGDWIVRQAGETEESYFSIVVAKDEFLRNHTETTYKEEWNKRIEHDQRLEQQLVDHEEGLSDKEIARKYHKTVAQVRVGRHIAKMNRRILSGK